MAAAAKRKAIIELSLDSKKMDSGLVAARKKLSAFGSSVGGKVVAGMKSIGAALGGGFGMQGASMLTDMVSDTLAVEKGLTRLQINGQMSEQQMAKFRTTMTTVSKATGVARAELVSGAQAYVAFTGDAAGAERSLSLFADVANATGTPMADIAATAAAMRENMKIDPKDFRAAFDVITTQGKVGAVEIGNLAAQMSNVAPMFAKFGGGTGVKGMATLGAVLQVMRKDFGSVEETATGFKGIMSEMTRHSDKLKKKGINVFKIDPKTKKTVKRDFLEIVDDIAKARANGRISEQDLIHLLGEQKAVNALNAVIDRRAEVEDLQTKAMNSNAIAKDSAKYLESSAGKIEKAWNSVKNAVAEALTPERINALANALTKAADAFTAVIGGISSIGTGIAKIVGGESYDDSYADEYRKDKAALLADTDNLSREEKLQMAGRFERGKKEIKGLGASGDGVRDAQYFAMQDAASELRQKADPWFSKSQPAQQFDPKVFSDAIVMAIGKLQLNIGNEPISKAVADSRVTRSRPGGRY